MLSHRSEKKERLNWFCRRNANVDSQVEPINLYDVFIVWSQTKLFLVAQQPQRYNDQTFMTSEFFAGVVNCSASYFVVFHCRWLCLRLCLVCYTALLPLLAIGLSNAFFLFLIPSVFAGVVNCSASYFVVFHCRWLCLRLCLVCYTALLPLLAIGLSNAFFLFLIG